MLDTDPYIGWDVLVNDAIGAVGTVHDLYRSVATPWTVRR
jgi:hypothetical protein